MVTPSAVPQTAHRTGTPAVVAAARARARAPSHSSMMPPMIDRPRGSAGYTAFTPGAAAFLSAAADHFQLMVRKPYSVPGARDMPLTSTIDVFKRQ